VRHQTRLHGISTVGRSRPLAAIVTEHTAIFAAVAAGDADAAASAMAVHLTTTRDLLLAQDGAGPDSTTSPLEET
jgi:DNA-binding GntR family transcriptional regulator